MRRLTVPLSLALPAFCSLQVFLNTYGIQTQTPQQVEPIQIWAQQELVKVGGRFFTAHFGGGWSTVVRLGVQSGRAGGLQF